MFKLRRVFSFRRDLKLEIPVGFVLPLLLSNGSSSESEMKIVRNITAFLIEIPNWLDQYGLMEIHTNVHPTCSIQKSFSSKQN